MLSGYGQFSSIVDTPAGPLVVGSEEQLTTTWQWPGENAPPALPPYTPPLPLETPLVQWGATIEPGVVYRYPLHIHCGMDVLGELNGAYWYRVEGRARTGDRCWRGAATALADRPTVDLRLPHARRSRHDRIHHRRRRSDRHLRAVGGHATGLRLILVDSTTRLRTSTTSETVQAARHRRNRSLAPIRRATRRVGSAWPVRRTPQLRHRRARRHCRPPLPHH